MYILFPEVYILKKRAKQAQAEAIQPARQTAQVIPLNSIIRLYVHTLYGYLATHHIYSVCIACVAGYKP